MLRPRLSRRQSGFTLLELLVVISIIALLMGLFLPALRQAREQSKQLVCRKNLTNIWRGVIVYAMENRDRAPFIERIDPKLDPFDPNHPTLVGNVLGLYVERYSFVCPSAVNGYPDTDPSSRRRWKLTYDFSVADSMGPAVPYDKALGANTGEYPDPAVVNEYHFDGRPLRKLRVGSTVSKSGEDKNERGAGNSGGSDSAGNGEQNAPVDVDIVWTVSKPLAADTLGENQPGDILAGRPVYPHRGIVRRQADVYRSLLSAPDPRVVTARRSGYFQLHAENERSEIFLTRVTPDNNPDD